MRAGAVAMAVLVVTLVTTSGCATAPYFRPAAPPFQGKGVEVGVGPYAAFGREEMSVGSAAWVQAEVLPDVQLLMRGHGADLFRYDGQTDAFSNVLTGGAVGIRGLSSYFPTLRIGAEGMLDYQFQNENGPRHYISGIVGLPVAEQATKDVWVYTNITVGISIPLQDDVAPFFGITEIPMGVSWQATDWLIVVGEGGYSIPLNGGYGGVAAAFRF